MKNDFALIPLTFLITILTISCSKEEKVTPIPFDLGNAQGFEKTYGGIQDDLANSLLIKNNELYIFGTTKSFGDINGDHYLVKSDLNGNTISEHTFGGPMTEEGIDLIETNDGNFIILGSTTSSGAGQKDIHAIKIDVNGNIIWEKTYGGILDDTPQKIIELSNSEFCIAATTESFGAGSRDIYMLWIDQNGNLLRDKTHGGIDVDGSAELLEIDHQEIMLYGYTYNYGAGDRDLYLLKTNFNGDSLWSKTYGGSGYEESQAFSRLTDGGYLLCGHSSSTDPVHNMYGVKTTIDGSQTWDANFGGANHDGGQALLVNTEGNYVFIGRTMSFGAGMRDALMVITDPNGQEISSQYFGGPLNDRIDELIEHNNFYYLAGQTNSFGSGGADIFLIKLPK